MTWLRRIPLLGRWFGPKLSGPAQRDAVVALVARFQRYGFFVGSDPDDLLRRFQRDWRRPFDPADESHRPWFLALDDRHVWMDDTEADVGAGNQVYCEFLRAMAAISRGSFDPRDIAEVWDSATGPITVSFTLAGSHQQVQPACRDDWLDVDILAAINRMLATHQFACWGIDQMALVVCLPRDLVAAFQNEGLLPAECAN